ncbi:MAG: hypothetical protein GY832_32910 [Chloroflexi bacterium]|nr:hypothetical protein [Chloroflexota bacterium]
MVKWQVMSAGRQCSSIETLEKMYLDTVSALYFSVQKCLKMVRYLKTDVNNVILQVSHSMAQICLLAN